MDDEADSHEPLFNNFDDKVSIPSVCIEFGCNWCIGVYRQIHVQLQRRNKRFNVGQY